MKGTTGLSKQTIATAIAKRLESNTRTGGGFDTARTKFRNYREVSEHQQISVDTYKDSPVVPNKLNFFTKKSLISVVETLQQETLSAKMINQTDGFISAGKMFVGEVENENDEELMSWELC